MTGLADAFKKGSLRTCRGNDVGIGTLRQTVEMAGIGSNAEFEQTVSKDDLIFP